MRFFIFLFIPVLVFGGARHKRDGSLLPDKERKFAQLLTIQKRRIYCGRFNQLQRLNAIKYTYNKECDVRLTPDEAVLKVMEESGMPVSAKRREE